MVSKRRIGSESAENRQVLLQAAELLMREEGYAQVTSRRIAQRAGLKPQLVHYYFRTMDDLLVDLFRTTSERYLHALERIAGLDDPLVRMFELSCDASTAALQMEFLALANHRPVMHALILEFGERLNQHETAIVRAAVGDGDLPDALPPPDVLAIILQTVARGLAFAGNFNPQRFEVARDAVIRMLRALAATGAALQRP